MQMTPYTVEELEKLKCFRCGAPAEAQWSICSDGNQHRAICMSCDIELNALVLKFMGFKDHHEMMDRYMKHKGLEPLRLWCPQQIVDPDDAYGTFRCSASAQSDGRFIVCPYKKEPSDGCYLDTYL